MANQYKNKIIYGDQTLMDITDTTVSTEDVLEGQVFYSANGARSVGTLTDATTTTHGLMSAADKNKLDNINEINIKWIDNKYINASGNEVSYELQSATDFIPVTGSVLIFYLDYHTSDTYHAFYDANKTFISNFTHTEGRNRVAIPSNAAYVRFSSISEVRDTLIIPQIKKYDNVWLQEIPITGTYTTGKYLNESTGEETVLANWEITDYQECFDDVIYINGLGFGGRYNAFYDAEKNYINVFQFVPGMNKISVPNGAKYYRLSFATNTQKIVSIYREEPDIPKPLIQNNILKNAKHTLSSTSSLTLAHFSDIHGDFAEAKNIVQEIDKYPALVNDIICTGDLINNHSAEDFTSWDSRILVCIGNHDSSTYVNNVRNWVGLSMAERSAKYIEPFKSNWGITHTNGLSYYYKDYVNEKVRLIAIDIMLYSSAVSSNSEGDAQLTWLGGLLDDAITNDYHVLIATHVWHGGGKIVNSGFSSMRLTLNNDGTVPVYAVCDTPDSVIELVATKITGGLNFIGYICGHEHDDYIVDATGDMTQLMFGIGAGTNQVEQQAWLQSYKDGQNPLFNFLTINTADGLLKLVRGNIENTTAQDFYMREKKYLTYNYVDHKLIENGYTISGEKIATETYVDEAINNIGSATKLVPRDDITLIENKYISNSNGTEIVYNTWDCTDFIDISGDKFIYYLNSTTGDIYNAFYDSNKTFISNFTSSAGRTEVYIPTNAKYARMSFPHSLASSLIVYKEESTGLDVQINGTSIVNNGVANISTMTGATSSAAGTAGLIPAPTSADREKFFRGDGTWDVPPGARAYEIDLDTVTNTSGSYTHTTTVQNVREFMKPMQIECSNPDAFQDKISVTTGDGFVTLTCASVSGTSTVKVTVMEYISSDYDIPGQVTSTEFDILAGRIGNLSQLTTTNKSDLVSATNELNNKITAYKKDVGTLDGLKSDLLSFTSGLSTKEVRPYCFWASASFYPFISSYLYCGDIRILNGGQNLQFTVAFESDHSDLILMAYNRGTWSINELSTKIAKNYDAPWSGYTLTNRDSYVENKTYHLNFSVTVPAYGVTAQTWYTVAFCNYLPSNANGAKFPIVYSVNNKMFPTLGQVVKINNTIVIQAFITSDIKTTEASTAGNFYFDTSYTV